MALVVEDGSLVAGADSYIALAAARTYAAGRGLLLAADDSTAEQQLRRAFDKIEGYRSRYQGEKASSDQLTQWPRTSVVIDGNDWSSAVIPNEIKYAQVHFAAAIQGGVDLSPVASGEAFAIREKIGPIETEYSEAVSTSGVPIVRAAEDLFAPLMRNSGGLVSTERA
jgi:hypothetical protein